MTRSMPTHMTRSMPTHELPLSPSQRRTWFLEQAYESGAMFHLPLYARTAIPLRAEALRQSFNATVLRHDILRVTFALSGEEPVQTVTSFEPPCVPLVDLCGLSPAEREPVAQRIVDDEAQRRFDLQTGPVVRAALLRLSATDHIFLPTLHHVVGDGWSGGVLWHEITTHLEAFSEGLPSPLPALPRQFTDDVLAHGGLAENRRAGQIAYWRQQLADLPPRLDLPSAHRARDEASTSGAHNRLVNLSVPLSAAIEALAKREEVTVFMVLVSALAILLYRYTGQTDVVIATPIANRNRPDVEPLIGCFANTLSLRIDLSGDPRYVDLLERVRLVTLEAYDNQDLPFETVLEALRLSSDARRTSLAQVMFQIQNSPLAGALQAGGWTPVPVASAGMPFELSLSMWRRGTNLRGELVLDASLFDDRAPEYMIQQFTTLLTGVIANPDQRVSMLPVVSAEERHQLLVDWDRTGAYRTEDRCLHELFQDRVDVHPDAPAISFEGSQVSYAQLDAEANRIAHALSDLPRDERPVAVLLENGPRQVATLLGVLKAGHAFAAFDVRVPADRVMELLSALAPKALVSDELTSLNHPNASSTSDLELVVVLDASMDGNQLPGMPRRVGADILGTCSTSRPDVHIRSTDRAYIAHTSGSTGRPKSIPHTHRTLGCAVQWFGGYFAAGPGMRVGQWASIAFDPSYYEIFGALCHGALLCPVPRNVVADAWALTDWAKRERLTLLDVTPSFAREMIEPLRAHSSELGSHPLPQLAHLCFLGEPLSTDLVAAYLDLFPACPTLHNLYGPTEGILATCADLGREALARRVIPAGRPIDGAHVLLLDRHRHLAPIGALAEVYIRSHMLADGYAHEPAETARAFSRGPFQVRPPERLYRTGDLGRWSTDGQLLLCGRADNQVKVRGVRVEIEEIEAAISDHPDVHEAVVLPQLTDQGEVRLGAYVVARIPDDTSSTVGRIGVLEVDHLTEVKSFYDAAYASPAGYSKREPGINLRVWAAILHRACTEEEILESVDDTVSRIVALDPRRVLEIGAGSGLLLWRLAPRCETYCATDFSDAALQYVRTRIDHTRSSYSMVSLERRAAHELPDLESVRFDTVILNLVVTHFPSEAYLARVLDGALDLLRPGGHIFVGGVRSLSLFTTFCNVVELQRATGAATRPEISLAASQRLAMDDDLILDPRWFRAFAAGRPGVAHVAVSPKGGRAHNEMTRYLYDVVIHKQDGDHVTTQAPWRDWQQHAGSVDALRRILAGEPSELVAFSDIPNARLRAELQVSGLFAAPTGPLTAREIKQVLRQPTRDNGIDPMALWTMAATSPYEIELSWSEGASDGSFDLICRRPRQASDSADRRRVFVAPRCEVPARMRTAYASHPLRSKVAASLPKHLRRFLERRLSGPFVPHSFTVLDRLPRLPNGKIARSALPASAPVTEVAVTAPRTELERELVNLWQGLLARDSIGVDHDFFEAGGHSLLVTRMLNRVRRASGVEVPLRDFLRDPTIAHLAELIHAGLPSEVESPVELAVTIQNPTGANAS
jgi:amino acid adenylation domain-containing protein